MWGYVDHEIIYRIDISDFQSDVNEYISTVFIDSKINTWQSRKSISNRVYMEEIDKIFDSNNMY